MKEDTKKRLQRFIVRNNYVLRFITATLFALIIVISVIFGLKALFLELSIPNRPIVIPIFRKVRQSGTIEDGRPVYGEETYMPLQLRNIGRKPAIDITWTFAITGVGKFPWRRPRPILAKGFDRCDNHRCPKSNLQMGLQNLQLSNRI
jgi:hypothetical protein